MNRSRVCSCSLMRVRTSAKSDTSVRTRASASTRRVFSSNVAGGKLAPSRNSGGVLGLLRGGLDALCYRHGGRRGRWKREILESFEEGFLRLIGQISGFPCLFGKSLVHEKHLFVEFHGGFQRIFAVLLQPCYSFFPRQFSG